MRQPRPAVAAPAGRLVTPALGWLGAAMIAAGLALTFLAPPDVSQGYLSRILPVHVSSSWLAYLSFGVTALYSLAYLVRRRPALDRVAAASAEVGVVFIVFTLFSGSLWGRPAWGTYWQWDPRLTTTALMLAAYVGYLMVRGLIDDPARRARVSAAIGVVASVGVPVNYLSVLWWRGLHQAPTFDLAGGHSYLRGNPELELAFFVTLTGFQVFYLYLVRLRGALERRRAAREAREEALELGAVSGLLAERRGGAA